jgi:hypothetical protein
VFSRRTFLAAAGLLYAGALAPSRARAAAPPPIPALPLSVAVVEDEGTPVCDVAWVDEQLAEATTLFAPLGMTLRKVGSRALPARFARLETRADRDALAEALEARRINVMVVASLRDVDDAERLRMGVHWRHRKTPARHWIIVAATARRTVLAHELGHYFGLGHTAAPDNVMSYERTGGPVFFTAAQAERMRSFARSYVAMKQLDPA